MNNYDAGSIQVLEGLDAVRKRPGMYIGSTDYRGLHHLVYEIVDNAIDEVLAGFASVVEVRLLKNGMISISDNGRGIPVDKHSTGVSAVEVIFTILHAGGKFDGSSYKTAGGLHGVGASVVNALSDYVKVESFKNKEHYSIEFHNGGKIKSPLQKLGKTIKTGSTVTFLPAVEVFHTIEFNYKTIEERLRENAFLIKNLTISIIDEVKEKETTYHYENGILEFINYINEDKEIVHDTIYFEGITQEIEVELAFQYTNTYSENIMSFVNNIRTADGGTHETALKTAITKVINEYAKEKGIRNKKEKNLEGKDIREGINAILSLRIPEHLLQFESQTKSKLGTPEARSAVEEVVSKKLAYFLEENKEIAIKLIEKASKSFLAREAAKKAKDSIRNGKKAQKKLLSGKLTPANSKKKSEREIFLVEGDSAGGSAKSGRDRFTQAILPLRGKVINTEKTRIEEVLKNEEISTIIHTLGCGIHSEFDITQLQYDKVIIMTDADTDGAHIQVLLLTFFYRYMKELLEKGHVYIALPPLYKVSVGKKFDYAWNESELKQLVQGKKNYVIQRYKGLGEMNADQLWETTMDPKTRTLIKVNVDDLFMSEKKLSILMGDNVEKRRDWIENHVDFSADDFEVSDYE